MTAADDTGAQPAPIRDDGHAGERPGRRPPVRVRAGSGADLLALVPHLLGFYPERSLVVLGLGGKRVTVRVAFRYDLPDPADAELAADIADHAASVLRREHLTTALLVGYGPAALAESTVATAMGVLVGDGVWVVDALRADSGRFWSYLCDDPDCCPDEGTRYDPGSHPLAAAMSGAGLPALPDRAALARTLRPPSGSVDAIRQATRCAERRLTDLGAQHCADGGRDPRALTARTGRAAVRRAIRCYRTGGSISSRDELAWLAVLLADLRVRDDAWARMDPRHALAHCRLWTDVVRGAATEYVPAPASLLAFVAWQSGNGALAAVAVDRALAARPGYSMALLLHDALTSGLPPSAAKLPMTPAEVAASYDPRRAVSRRPRQSAEPGKSGRSGRTSSTGKAKAGRSTRSR
jgi:hypothetical protein